MYAYIKGEIIDISEDNLVLECNNIGYNIRIPLSVAQRLPGIGATVKIYTYTSVREDAFNLFGFLSKDDVEIYKKINCRQRHRAKGGAEYFICHER